jgi:hypothetical protein
VGEPVDPDDRPPHHPCQGALELGIDGVVGGDVLQVAGHGIETKTAGGADIAQAHQPRGRERAPL